MSPKVLVVIDVDPVSDTDTSMRKEIQFQKNKLVAVLVEIGAVRGVSCGGRESEKVLPQKCKIVRAYAREYFFTAQRFSSCRFFKTKTKNDDLIKEKRFVDFIIFKN